MASHNDVAEKFGKRQINSRTKKVEWSASRVFCEDRIIYSYGGHFPMAVYLGEKPGVGHFFIKNDDKYSSSTSAHQSCVREHCPGPSVSRSALSKFIQFSELTLDNVYLWRPSMFKHLWYDSTRNVYYSDYIYNYDKGTDSAERLFTDEYKLPRTGKFKAYRKQDEYGPYKSGVFTVQEVLVLKVKKQYLLCVDGKVSLLARQPKNISEALKLRKKTAA